jgi:hypothetical protein
MDDQVAELLKEGGAGNLGVFGRGELEELVRLR